MRGSLGRHAFPAMTLLDRKKDLFPRDASAGNRDDKKKICIDVDATTRKTDLERTLTWW